MWDLRSGDDGRLGKKYFGGASETYPAVLLIYRDTYLGFRLGCPELEWLLVGEHDVDAEFEELFCTELISGPVRTFFRIISIPPQHSR
jgi:hypothetical protein